MSAKTGIFAGLGALTLVGVSLVAISTTPAVAQPSRPTASTACGSVCTTISAQEYGSGWVMEAAGPAEVGTQLWLAPASNTSVEDFKLILIGTVSDVNGVL
jgi:hypothetical protein